MGCHECGSENQHWPKADEDILVCDDCGHAQLETPTTGVDAYLYIEVRPNA